MTHIEFMWFGKDTTVRLSPPHGGATMQRLPDQDGRGRVAVGDLQFIVMRATDGSPFLVRPEMILKDGTITKNKATVLRVCKQLRVEGWVGFGDAALERERKPYVKDWDLTVYVYRVDSGPLNALKGINAVRKMYGRMEGGTLWYAAARKTDGGLQFKEVPAGLDPNKVSRL